MRRILAVAVLALAGSVAMAPAAQADEANALVNGDLAGNWCAGPWNWEGPVLIRSASGPYAACLDDVLQ